MYKYNGYFPVVLCLCGRRLTLKRATVCECGTTLRFRHVPGQHRLFQPVAWAQDKYDLAASPLKRPVPVDWEEEKCQS